MALRAVGRPALPVPAAGGLDVDHDRSLDEAIRYVARSIVGPRGERRLLESWLKRGINPAAQEWIRAEYWRLRAGRTQRRRWKDPAPVPRKTEQP